jgi:D-inositol-3-phosphate glycosyltransferase
MKKVAIVITSTGWGGLELNVLKLAQELQNHSIDVHFICQKGTRFEQQLPSMFTNTLRLSKVKKYFDFKNAKVVANYLKNQEITSVFTAFRPDLDLLLWAKRKHSFKLIHQQQMQIGPPKKGFFQTLRFKAVDQWLTPLNWLKEEVIAKTKLDPSKIKIVPLGVKKELFLQEQVDQSTARAFFNVQTDAYLIGVLGRIDEKKGQLFLVKAIKQLRSEGKNVALLIVGEPTIDDPKGKLYHTELVQYINDNNLKEHVFFAPFTKEVRTFYAAIDLFVMSSEGETFGMVTVEAMFAKKPVLGTNSSGTPEVLGHGTRGGLYEFNKLDSFINAFNDLRSKLDHQELNLEAIQQEAMNLYSLEKEVRGVMDVL